MSWIYNGLEFNNEMVPEGAVGFVYCINNITNGRKYIGRKSLYSDRKTKISNKEKTLTKNNRKKFKVVRKDSNWINYTGSSDDLNLDIKKGDIIEKIILQWCYSKLQLTYYETKYLFINNVLESTLYYNNNILSKFFKSKLKLKLHESEASGQLEQSI